MSTIALDSAHLKGWEEPGLYQSWLMMSKLWRHTPADTTNQLTESLMPIASWKHYGSACEYIRGRKRAEIKHSIGRNGIGLAGQQIRR